VKARGERRVKRTLPVPRFDRATRAGIAVGTLAFLALLAILLFAGELSSSKFLYVDF
jgi:hypothetical protein